jgi:hypothetical protein|nr:MAG TPA: tail fiber protein [Caudoviricetes sp.]
MIETLTTKVTYQGDGETVSFPFSFFVDEASSVCVAIYNKDTQITKKLLSDYYVDMVGKTVKYPGYATGQTPPFTEQPAVLSARETITIYRETEITQLINLGNKYPLPDIERMSDKMTLIVQELKEILDRTITIDIGSEETAGDLKERIFTAEETASEMASRASTSAGNAAVSEKAAKASEENASASEKSAAKILADIEAAATTVGGVATMYSNTRTYRLADQVMLPDGTTYRCIAQSTGEYPPTSGKWVQTAMTTQDTFERDLNDDLMPAEYAKATRLWAIDTEEDICPAENAG